MVIIMGSKPNYRTDENRHMSAAEISTSACNMLKNYVSQVAEARWLMRDHPHTPNSSHQTYIQWLGKLIPEGYSRLIEIKWSFFFAQKNWFSSTMLITLRMEEEDTEVLTHKLHTWGMGWALRR